MAGPARARSQEVKPPAAAQAPKAPAGRADAPPARAPSRLPSPSVAAAILKGAQHSDRVHPAAPAKRPAAPRTAMAAPPVVAAVPGGVALARPPVAMPKPAMPAPVAAVAATAALAGPLTRPAAPMLAAVAKVAAPVLPTEKTAAAAATVALPTAEAKAATPDAAAGPASTPADKAAAAPTESDAVPAADAKAYAAEGAAAPAKEGAKPEAGGKDGKSKQGKGPAAGTAAEEEGGAGAAAAAVKLHIPEPPTGPSPATKKRIGGVKSRAGGKAASHGKMPDGGAQVADARKSVTEPDAEANAKAQAALIAQVQAGPSPEIVKLCERIREVIRKKRPPDEDALVEAKPDGEAMNAGNQLNSTVEGETKKVQDNYGPVNDPPAAAAPAPGADLAPQPAPAGTAPINAKAATPDAVPDGNVSLDKDAAEAKKKQQDAGMETEPAKLVQSGPVADARAAQGELDQAAKEDPAKVLGKQKETLVKAEGDMAALQAQALAALTTSRDTTSKANASRQGGMVGSEESMRANAGAEAKKTFDDAKNQVNALLQPLAQTAMADWEAAKEVLVTNFKNDLAIVKKRVDERHSGVGGFFTGLWDAVAGLPDWAEEAYTKAETNFGDGVIAKLTSISTHVNSVIATCDLIIKNARERITRIFSELPGSLKEWASQEQAKFDGQLDQLHKEVISARDNFNKDLVERSSAAVDEVRAEIAELRKKAGGLVGRIVNAINKFIEDPIKFIIEGLLEILGIPPASFWAVVAKIKKVVKDIADDPMKFANNLLAGLAQGFSQFFDNILSHLLKGFIGWLTGGLAGVGVQLPKDASLKSIMTFFLQLMGITWPRIRKILVKHIGAKNVALIEKVYSMVSLLIEKGPEGIFEMIKEKLDPQSIVDQVVQLAVDFMISAVVKAVTPRIIALFNPAGAIIQALEAIYRVLKWVFQNAAKIFTLIETVVNGIADILAGSIGGFANAVEKALAMLIAPVIGFIADYLGFGDLPGKIADRIKSFQEMVLGFIEEVLVFLIEKGKALLAALGLGSKEKDKDKNKKGEGLDQIGEQVDFDAEGDPHSLWIEVEGEHATLMVASDKQSLKQYLANAAKNKAIASEVARAKALADKADIDADEIARVAVHETAEDESKEKGVHAKLTQKNKKLTDDERELAKLLEIIFTEMKPIEPRIGNPVADIKRAPYGYDLKPDRGTYEYDESYDFTNIERDDGFGSANQSLFPKVHVKDDLVGRGAGLLPSDWPVIEAYRSAINSIRPTLEADEAPRFKQSPDAPANQLEEGKNKLRHFNWGVRKQMEAIVKAIRDGDDVTGVEVVVGRRRVDYLVRRQIGDRSVTAMVEYKHWAGKMTPDRRVELADKLDAQLTGQIIGGGARFPMLIVQWPAFNTLDDDAKAAFFEVLNRVQAVGEERGVTVMLQI